jgi:hypothetical protein
MAVGDTITNTLDRIESNASGNILLNLGVALLALRHGNPGPLEEAGGRVLETARYRQIIVRLLPGIVGHLYSNPDPNSLGDG